MHHTIPTPRPSPSDRRAFPRLAIERACKVRHALSHRTMPGRTINASPGGLLIELRGSRRLAPGDAIDVFVSWDGSGVVPASSAVEARVVRALSATDDRQIVALRFAESVPLAQVA